MFDKLRELFRRQHVTVPMPEEPVLPRRGPFPKGPPPSAPGIYRIIDRKTGKIIYIGTTNDLSRRPKEHQRSGLHDSKLHIFAYQLAHKDATAIARYDVEKIKIEKHTPCLNRNGGGGPW